MLYLDQTRREDLIIIKQDLEHIKCVFSLADKDFEVHHWRVGNTHYYSLDVEGYIGFESISDMIDMYSECRDKYYDYLIESKVEKPEKSINWELVYKTNSIDIRNDGEYYWNFMDTKNASNLWQLYDNFSDSIDQIIEFSHTHKERETVNT